MEEKLRHKLRQARYRQRHPDRVKDSYRKWRKEHFIEYVSNHPNRIKSRNTIYRHKRKGFLVNLSARDVEAMFDKSNYCPQCGRKFTEPRLKTLDRINDNKVMAIETVQVLCLKCNSANAPKPRGEEWKKLRNRN